MSTINDSFSFQLERFFRKRFSPLSRVLIVLACVSLALSFFFPLWHINLIAPQYRDGLDLWIYAHKLIGGNGGQDIVEINILNHYIGMAEIHEADFWEMQIIPFAIGFFILYGLRTAVFGQMSNLVDTLVLFVYFALFSLVAFVSRLHSYGHDLDPQAPMTVEPFWPMLIGTKQIANMTQTSLPGVGSYLLVLAMVLMLLAAFFSRNQPTFLEAHTGAAT